MYKDERGGVRDQSDICLKDMKFKMLVAAFLLVPPITACVWVEGTTKEARRIEIRRHPLLNLQTMLRHSKEVDLREEGAEMEAALRGKTSLDDRNDYAVALMYLGRANEAVSLLEELELEKPGEYATA